MRDSLGRFLKGDKRPHISARNKARVGKSALHWKGGKLKIECPVCYVEFSAWKSDKRTYCSRKCCFASTVRSEKISTAKIGIESPYKGIPRTKVVRKKISKAQIGKHHSPSTEFVAGKPRPDITGEKHPRWIMDRRLLKDEKKLRNGQLSREWSRAVKNRDGWKCKISNGDCSGCLESHHILRWSDYPELRYEVNNGITLCRAHHPRKRAEEKRLSPYFTELVSVSKEFFEMVYCHQ